MKTSASLSCPYSVKGKVLKPKKKEDYRYIGIEITIKGEIIRVSRPSEAP